MDLLDFDGQGLYFDEPLSEDVEALLVEASENYADGTAEAPLLRAYFLASANLTVLVALYRFYYYQHRFGDALHVARRALEISGARLGLPSEWRRVGVYDLGFAALQSMGMVRFYLLALKGAGYLSLRMGEMAGGTAMLAKVAELDPKDRMGTAALLEVVADCSTDSGELCESAAALE
ncbi:MAG: hypothetical protein P8174_00205 [Gemmatimonadota bacterium]